MKLNWFNYNQKPSNEDLLNILKRIERAYNIVELNKQEQIIFENDRQQQQQLFNVLSIKDKRKSYEVDADIKTCTCPDFNFRLLKCKHIIAVELLCLLSSPRSPYTLSPSQSSSVIAA